MIFTAAVCFITHPALWYYQVSPDMVISPDNTISLMVLSHTRHCGKYCYSAFYISFLQFWLFAHLVKNWTSFICIFLLENSANVAVNGEHCLVLKMMWLISSMNLLSVSSRLIKIISCGRGIGCDGRYNCDVDAECIQTKHFSELWPVFFVHLPTIIFLLCLSACMCMCVCMRLW